MPLVFYNTIYILISWPHTRWQHSSTCFNPLHTWTMCVCLCIYVCVHGYYHAVFCSCCSKQTGGKYAAICGLWQCPHPWIMVSVWEYAGAGNCCVANLGCSTHTSGLICVCVCLCSRLFWELSSMWTPMKFVPSYSRKRMSTCRCNHCIQLEILPDLHKLSVISVIWKKKSFVFHSLSFHYFVLSWWHPFVFVSDTFTFPNKQCQERSSRPAGYYWFVLLSTDWLTESAFWQVFTFTYHLTVNKGRKHGRLIILSHILTFKDTTLSVPWVFSHYTLPTSPVFLTFSPQCDCTSFGFCFSPVGL